MKPDLKVVGEITPPDYKDPVKMLRNIADGIEAGDYGDIDTIVVVTCGSGGYNTFGGGKDSGLHACAFLLATGHARLVNIPWGGT